MDEVSNRAFSYFEEAERAGWIHLDELVAGSGLRLVDLRDPRKRTDWEDWVFLCARFESLVGTERLEESAVFGVTSAFAGDMAKVASLFVDPLELYRAGLEWAGAANYRCIRFSVKPHQGGALQVEARLEEQHAQSRAWFAMLRGGLAVIPRFVGLADAVVEGEISATHLSCRVIPPPSRTLALAGRRFLSTLLAPRALVDELTFQQEQLQATSLELQRSERDVRDTLARLPAMVGLVRDERLTYANETLLEALGTDLRGARARDLLAWIAPPDRAAFRSAVLDERSTGEVVVRIEGRSTRWARASGFTMPAAQRLRGFYAVDVTEEQAARAGMLHHDETLRAMSSALPDLFARIDGEGRVLDLLGSSWGAFDLRGAVGRRLDELDDRTGPRLRTADVAHLLRLTRSELDRVELTLGPERDRIFEWTATRVANKDEWLLVGRDVTSRRAAERQLAIAERMASLGTLAAAVGHEINNPLAYVIMNQEVVLEGLARLAEGGALDLEELRSAARDARHGAERVRGIVRHLKRFSRLDATDVGSVDLRAVIAEAIAMTATEARLRARVIEDLDEVPAVSGDEGALVQVFVNLLANAAQAIPEGDPASNRIEVKTDRQGELGA